MASAVTRPEVVYAAPLKVNIAGKFAVLGPASVQAPAAFLFPCDFIFAHAFFAFTVNRNGTSVAGYARFAIILNCASCGIFGTLLVGCLVT